MKLRIFVPSAAALLTDHRPHGEGLIAWKLLSGLAGRGHQIVACAREVDIGSEPPFEVVETGRLSRLESLEPLAQARAVARELRRRGGPRAFDLAHWIFPPNLDEIAFAPADTLPLVYGPHALSWPDVWGRSFRAGDIIRGCVRPVLRRRSRHALNHARLLLFAVPEAIEELPVEARERARILPFGVDADRFEPSPLPQEPAILFVGRLEQAKGADLLLEAFARLPEPRPRLLIAGSGPEEGPLGEQARRLGLAERVEWLGPVEHAQVPALMRRASVLCSASIGEPYGMVLLEAMASGRAVVAMAAGGPRFLVDHDVGGLLVWPPTAEALGAALEQLLGDPRGLAEMGHRNRERVERELSWDRVLDQLEELYAEVLGRPA